MKISPIPKLPDELNVAVFPPPDSKVKGPVIMPSAVTLQLPAPALKVIVGVALKVMVPVDSKVTFPPGLTPPAKKFMFADALVLRAPVDVNWHAPVE